MAREENSISGKAADSLGKRLVLLLFSAVFAVAFGLGGYAAGLKPLVQTLRLALDARSWQPVQAEVLSAELKTHTSSDGPSYEALVRYRYEVGGRSYQSTQLGLDPAGYSDNIAADWSRDWARRLQAAKERGQRITVLVDPHDPARALIDPSIRWQLQLFRLPFALVFTGVGVVAAGFFVALLLGLGRGRGGAGTEALRSSPRAAPGALVKGGASKSVGAIWFFAFFWCGIAFPMAAMLWTSSGAPWYAKAFISIFVMVGVGLIGLALHQTHMAWRYAGSALTLLPSQPRGGHPLEATLLLPERAAAYQQDQALQLRLAQYRVDESSSGSPERCVESFTEAARVQRTADAGLRVSARFNLPVDAPPHGAQRSGERVDWRLELLHSPGGGVELTYDLPVQAAVPSFGGAGSEPPDRFDRRAAWKQETPIPPAHASSGEEGADADEDRDEHAPVILPASVTLQETAEGWHYRFAQTGWRWAAGLVLAGLVVEGAINGRWGAQGLVLPRSFLFAGLAWWALAAFALHAATRRWELAVRDEGIVVRCRSWLWSRTRTLPGQASQQLVHKLLYSTGSGGSEERYYAVYAREAGGALVRLTPGVAGDAAATAAGQSIAQAWAHRQGRFSPGGARPVRTSHSRPAWGALLLAVALAWHLFGPQLMCRNPLPACMGADPGGAAATSYSSVDGRLLDAQNAGDAPALRAALAAGANPNLLAPNGSSVLMLAAHRGQMEHIEALLAAGARPDLRQTQKDSERGDTALLRAFYGGHLAAAERLVQAGASLSARNRWDWGPMHMAAQSGCVACLDWLAARGQAIDEPAPASRGETPTMLAAGRGRVQALQWFEARGVDLARQDPHGKTALDWARFKQQAEAEQWLLQRTAR